MPWLDSEFGSRRAAAELMLTTLTFAAFLGSVNLLAATLSHLPESAAAAAASELGDDGPLTCFVLESVRLAAPVNQINVYLSEAKTVVIGKGEEAREVAFPAGTRCAANIMGGCSDAEVWPDPTSFDPCRANLKAASLNFNAIGYKDAVADLPRSSFDPPGAGGCPHLSREQAEQAEAQWDASRVCPGRFLTTGMAAAVVRAYHALEPPAVASIPVLQQHHAKRYLALAARMDVAATAIARGVNSSTYVKLRRGG